MTLTDARNQSDPVAAIAALRTMLDTQPLEDVVDALRAHEEWLDVSASADLRSLTEDVYDRMMDGSEWLDGIKAGRAHRWALDAAERLDRVDGDTPTYWLIKALLVDPSNDEWLREYVAAVNDSQYAYTNRRLGDVAAKVDDAGRKRRLLLLNAVVEHVTTGLTAPGSSEKWIKESFARAVGAGATAKDWQSVLIWLGEQKPPLHTGVPVDLFERMT